MLRSSHICGTPLLAASYAWFSGYTFPRHPAQRRKGFEIPYRWPPPRSCFDNGKTSQGQGGRHELPIGDLDMSSNVIAYLHRSTGDSHQHSVLLQLGIMLVGCISKGHGGMFVALAVSISYGHELWHGSHLRLLKTYEVCAGP